MLRNCGCRVDKQSALITPEKDAESSKRGPAPEVVENPMANQGDPVVVRISGESAPGEKPDDSATGEVCKLFHCPLGSCSPLTHPLLFMLTLRTWQAAAQSASEVKVRVTS